MNRIYFDNNATTPVAPEVLQAMLPYFCEQYGNASSIHSFGQKSRSAVENAREQVAKLLGARAGEIVFTSGGTESDNLAIRGILGALPDGPKHVITTQIEHSAVRHTCEELAKDGVAVTFLPVSREGIVDPEDVRRAIRPETRLIAVMHANNELGTVQPVAEISAIAREHGILFHTDAVQSAGKIPIDVERLAVDTLAISGHKLYAPKGVGALFVRKGAHVKPILTGGHHERDRRPGTENVPGIVGLGAAAELAMLELPEKGVKLAALRDRFESGLLATVPESRCNGSAAPRTPNTSNITFQYIEGESLVIALDLRGLACSTGAACSSGAVAPSPVLTAIGLPPHEARASIRFSLGRTATDADVDAALRIVPEAVERMRELSPVYRKPVATR